MPVKSYDPKDVVVNVGGVPMQGFADGTYINVTRSNDSFTSVSGADGEVARAKSNDKRGEMTLTLLQTSLSNDVLSGFAKLDEAANAGVVPIIIKDLTGLTVLFSGNGWIKKPADFERGKEIANAEWSLELADMDVFIGGVALPA